MYLRIIPYDFLVLETIPSALLVHYYLAEGEAQRRQPVQVRLCAGHPTGDPRRHRLLPTARRDHAHLRDAVSLGHARLQGSIWVEY